MDIINGWPLIPLRFHDGGGAAVLALVLGLVPPLTIVLSISHRHSAFLVVCRSVEAFNFTGSLLSKSSTLLWALMNHTFGGKFMEALDTVHFFVQTA